MKLTVFLLTLLLPLLAAAEPDRNAGQSPQEERILPDCPGTPNCVSSLSRDPARRIEPLPPRGTPEQSMELLVTVVTSMPRTKIVSATSERVEAEFRTLLGFVDDVLFAVSSDREVIHVRSASRKGSWDLGVNRRRVEKIRRQYLKSRSSRK